MPMAMILFPSPLPLTTTTIDQVQGILVNVMDEDNDDVGDVSSSSSSPSSPSSSSEEEEPAIQD